LIPVRRRRSPKAIAYAIMRSSSQARACRRADPRTPPFDPCGERESRAVNRRPFLEPPGRSFPP
jgi:hypothetical protein